MIDKTRVSLERFLIDLQLCTSLIAQQPAGLANTDKKIDAASIASLDECLAEAFVKSRAKASALLKAHKEVVPDSPVFSRISLFKGIGLCRQETAHTNTLAWLINPNESHGFGNTLFVAMINSVVPTTDNQDALRRRLTDPRCVLNTVATEYRMSRSARLDVFVQGQHGEDPWLLLLEAKVDAQERTGQLKDYYEHGRVLIASQSRSKLRELRQPDCLGVFLSPDGRGGKSAEVGSEWATLSFTDLASGFLRIYPTLSDFPGYPFLKVYLTGLLEDVCRFSCAESVAELLKFNSPNLIEHLLGEPHA